MARAVHWRNVWVGDGEAVLDVPAKLAARVRVYSHGNGRKTDADDAVSIGLAALGSTGAAMRQPRGLGHGMCADDAVLVAGSVEPDGN